MITRFAKWAGLLSIVIIGMTNVAVAAPPSAVAQTAAPSSSAQTTTVSSAVARPAAGTVFDGTFAVPSFPGITYLNVALFYAGPNNSPPSACLGAGGNPGAFYQWALDLTTPNGIAMLKLVMQAYATGAQLEIVGNGTCNIQGKGTEDIQVVYINH